MAAGNTTASVAVDAADEKPECLQGRVEQELAAIDVIELKILTHTDGLEKKV